MTDSAPTHASAPAWLDELPLRAGPPWVAMGVRTLDLDRWLVFDDDTEAQLALKGRLAATRPGDVFAAEPGTEDVGAEVLALVLDWLQRHPPPARAASTAPAADPDRAGGLVQAGHHPLEVAGWMVPEDLCVMQERHGCSVLTAASVSFPSHWRLADKMGRSLAAIHAPVHHYAEELERKVDTFFARLAVDRPVVRRNLSLHDHDALFRPEPPETYGSSESPELDDAAAARLWLRSERQTLVRLPRSGAVLFTIKTQQCPAVLLSQRPDLCAALAERYRALMTELATQGLPAPVPAWWPEWLDAQT